LKQRVEDLMNHEMYNIDSLSSGTAGLQSINSITLSHTLLAICDERIEVKKGPLFTFCLAELTKRSDLLFEDIRRIAYACCLKDN
jgi:hypothetical protein